MDKYIMVCLAVLTAVGSESKAQEPTDSGSIKTVIGDFSGRKALYTAFTYRQSVDSLKADVERVVREYYDIHYGCAPMTYVGLSRLLGNPMSDEQLHRQAVTFSGGVAGSLKGTCGALTGALMALNNYASGDGQKLRGLSREVYDSLHDRYGSVGCDVIRKGIPRGKRCAECSACCLCVMNKVIDILYREGDLQVNTFSVSSTQTSRLP